MSVPETTNLHLKKPAYTNAADIFDMNDNMDILDQAIPDIWKTIYPVGSIFMSVNSTSPATLFGGGTWVQIKDCFLLSAGDTYTAGSTGGAESKSYTPAGTVGNHTLTTSEIPSHSHSLNNHVHSVGAHSHGLNSHTHSIPAHTHGATGGANLGFATFDNAKPVPTSSPTGVGFMSNGSYYAGYSTNTASGGSGTTGPASGNTANSSAFNSGAASGNTGASGGGGGHNHGFTGTAANINVMPPYLTVYMWKRTA